MGDQPADRLNAQRPFSFVVLTPMVHFIRCANANLNEFKQHFFEKRRNALVLTKLSWNITGFQFMFVPPRSPHFGGLWESAVKSTKTF
ncbi:hypothetical protein CVS40_6959 [Lucilia cuprina]|nr:hypothetical protein CVS40_6959 [Lucilia cuprina]